MMAVMLAAFLVSLDRTIVATAIPVITNHFNSLDDVGWYASAYLLTMSSLQMAMGRVYTFFDIKLVFLSCIGLFELGSIVCGTAPSSTALIIGRAIAGMGATGLFSGAITIMVHVLPLAKRPAYMGWFGSIFGIASVAGPLLGGAFTSNLTWRWCFFINLPIGGIAMVIIIVILKLPARQIEALSWREKLLRLDPLGNLFFIPSIICLLLALEWGGTTYPWSEWRIILLLVLFVVLLIVFIIIETVMPKTATIPLHIIKNRSVLAAVWYTFVTGASLIILVYFIPIWFQAIKGVSPVKSGIMNIPLVLGLVVASLAAGFLTKKIGYYAPWMLLGAVIMPIGAGLISTFTIYTGHSRWIGYQVLYGFGLGLGMQQSSIAVQSVLKRRDVPTGASLVFFFQGMGGSLFSSIGNNIFDNKLKQGLQKIPGLNAGIITNIGATNLRQVVSSQQLPSVLVAYNAALVQAFYVAAGVAAMAIIGAATVEWKSIKASGKQEATNSKPAKAVEENKGAEVV
ncbi:hypothetical protein OIDMADRAFT_203364 [Oidiodendron maius Zn]|uniref:Major facilitator superfamily (MFS) profile domain-containing protein n=1 Tax=Oidiodendron maius (strain Zn) TaxID=913774 RepID=A0A0C3H6A1_OIDMZ|nr:hypothetical protein OIDMADRAFT_203364 [Oidiodendron maius Zn]